jgi:RNA polymerase subunit RPABC4/transcription elongation factor Spt4
MAVMPETDANISDNADRCVCCGDVIPEGRQVCPKCEGDVDG